MNFILREAIPSDIASIFEMIKAYYLELDKGNNKPFLLTEKQLLSDYLSINKKINFIVAVYEDKILAYAAYFFSYEIFHGSSLVVEEVYVKREYRNLGISIFFFSHIVKVANDNNSYLIKWILDISDEKSVEIERKAGVIINNDDLILYIYKKDISLFLKENLKFDYEIRIAKGADLPDIYSLIQDFVEEIDATINIDIYKLMKDGFSNNPKFKFLIALFKDEVIGFSSFFEGYSTFNGKSLIVNKTYVVKKYRKKGVGRQLMNKIFEYTLENNYNRIETSISKYEVEKIERLKEYGVFPYDYLRMATFDKKAFNKLIN